MTKAFAYLRVSGASQVERDGFVRQSTTISLYARAHDLRIVKTFKEAGVSGTVENMNRPAWRALMTALYSDGVRTILIEKVDRLARDLMVQEAAIADLQKHGFTLISAMEPDLMAKDPTRVLIRQMMGVLAQYEKSQLVLKLGAARARKRARGERCDGRKPYGFRPDEPAILERMRALRASGLGFDKIADHLNTKGVKPRTGQRWYGGAINRILSR